MFDFIKKFLTKDESVIYCPNCGRGFRLGTIFPYFVISENNDLNIFKCKHCKSLFLTKKELFYDPSFYILYKSFKIEKNSLENPDCVGQKYFDFYEPENY